MEFSRVLVLCFAFVLGASLGCSDDDDEGTAVIRVMHAAKTLGRLTVLLDDDEVSKPLAYTEASDGFEVVIESEYIPRLRVFAEGIAPPVVDIDLFVLEDSRNILVVYTRPDDSIANTLLRQSEFELLGEDFRLNIGHFAPSINTAIDAYIVNPDSSLDGQIPAASGISFSTVSTEVDIRQGIYESVVTRSRSLIALLRRGAFPFEAGRTFYAFFLDGTTREEPLQLVFIAAD